MWENKLSFPTPISGSHKAFLREAFSLESMAITRPWPFLQSYACCFRELITMLTKRSGLLFRYSL